MTEKEWTKRLRDRLLDTLSRTPFRSCQIETGTKIPYGFEIRSYERSDPKPSISQYEPSINQYETDLVVLEPNGKERWTPRVIVEVKIRTISTHDAITYSQKALSHKTVHPYVRYGIVLGKREEHPLPGRLYRHGAHFDFMMSFRSDRPEKEEMVRFGKIVRAEIDASRKLEEIIYNSRRPDRDRYTILHKKLSLEQ